MKKQQGRSLKLKIWSKYDEPKSKMHIGEESNSQLKDRDEWFSYHVVQKKEVTNVGGNLRDVRKRSGRIIIHLIEILKKKTEEREWRGRK